jgi:hypothetical protein
MISHNARANALLYLYTLPYLALPEWITALVEQLNHLSILSLQAPFLSTELKKKKKNHSQQSAI